MGDLLNLAVYNPAILSDDEFIKSFVARREVAEQLLERLGEIKLDGLAQHRLILGQRGMGKTSMLRKLAIGIRENTTLSKILLPLTFREEQYNIHNLHTFWCNCIDALGDYFEACGQVEKAAQIDRDVAELSRKSPDKEGEDAYNLFQRWFKKEKRRPLLLLDNIDLILKGLKKAQWSFRRALQVPGGIVVIGAATGLLEATVDPKAAFYDFFHVTVLEKLTPRELFSCLRQLAQQRGAAGKQVTRVLNKEPERIHTLYDLTGGNPRTLVLLYLLLELDSKNDALQDLEQLLDQVTPLYKARVEELAGQARVVLDAVALSWNPITAARLANATGLQTGAVSTQLDRLQKIGLIEKVSLASTVRAGFQFGERFFNIWYLMRHAPRRIRNRLRLLTRFLQGFYTPRQLKAFANANQKDAAKEAFQKAVDHLPPHGANLLKAYAALSKDNFGDAAKSFKDALGSQSRELYSTYYDDILRVLRLAKARGFGDKLLTFFEDSGLKDSHWPLYAAFDAYLHGEERLQDVNPEVRKAALRMFNWLISRQQKN